MRRFCLNPMIGGVLFILLASFFLSLSSCAVTGNPDFSESVLSASTQSESDETPSPTASEPPAPTDAPSIDLLPGATAITAKSLGIDSIAGSNFYWSPDAENVVFMGAIRDIKDNMKLTENVYLYNLKDKQLVKLVDGVYDRMYGLGEPQWSTDGKLVILPFYDITSEKLPIYIYDTAKGSLDILPVEGMSPSISPDKSKVAYGSKDNGLCLFNLSDKTTTILPGKISGWNYLWFSDSTRLLFIRNTGKNPSGYEGAELERISVVDIRDPGAIQSFGEESVFRGMSWVIRDGLAWVISGWDDGYYLGAMDLDSKKFTDFGEFSATSWQVIGGKATFIKNNEVGGYNIGFHSLNRDMVELENFTTRNYSVSSMLYNIPLCLLPDGNLLYMVRSNAFDHVRLMISIANDKRFFAVATYDGNCIPIVSADGSRIALISQDGDKMYLLDASKITG